MTDFQKSRVYEWENNIVERNDQSIIPYDSLQTIVDYIWSSEGYSFPPKIIPMPLNNRRAWSKATRNQIWAPARGLPTWVLIHEMSHSMTFTFDGEECNMHGPDFVGIYMKLLDKYLKIPMAILMYTAQSSGVKFNINARPYFLD